MDELETIYNANAHAMAKRARKNRQKVSLVYFDTEGETRRLRLYPYSKREWHIEVVKQNEKGVELRIVWEPRTSN